MENPATAISQAESDFYRARNQAFWSALWAKIRGRSRSLELLNFEAVKQALRLHDESYLGLKDIPLEKIIGSVGRYTDFDRHFLPKSTVNKDRWKAVDMLTMGDKGFPPIEVYKVGEAYFVLDGNHRVSVARANNTPTIEAYVTEFKTDVLIDEKTQADELFLKAEYAGFLRKTRLKTILPDVDVVLTEPGRYRHILNHIETHRYFRGLECNCEISMDEAIASWYERVYMPMIEAIRESELLKNFPGRTEADLYVWLIKHQEAMFQHYGGTPMSPGETIKDFLVKIKGQKKDKSTP